ncbi:hypothetical protein GCM10022223_33190 [Kineosporia mesophila]|uniref:Uncharacterized protein n=1 Tax=Kineosporia mesophila TaxID=566012 RepID=A0ABP6ZPL4_9ACTN
MQDVAGVGYLVPDELVDQVSDFGNGERDQTAGAGVDGGTVFMVLFFVRPAWVVGWRDRSWAAVTVRKA